MPPLQAPSVSWEMVGEWCERLVGATASRRLFETGHLSAVIGVGLDDGRRVVVKARRPAERLTACARVHAHLWRAGYPCPEPLAGPALLDGFAVSIEAYVSAREPPSRTDAPSLCAAALARLVALAPPLAALPTLAPSPAWVDWHTDTGTLWPPPDDRDEDLNELRSPAWVDEAARRALQRLSDSDLPPVVGHVDWWAPNLLWADGSLRAVVDWDSVAALSEAAVVGVAAAIFAPTPPSVAETRAFLAGYERARGYRFSRKEVQASWAAGSWTRTFDAKKESVDGPGPIQAALAEEIEQRLSLARV